MYIALLGRQPELSIAEIECLFDETSWFSPETATFKSLAAVDIQRLGGSQKIGLIVKEISTTQWQKFTKEVSSYCQQEWKDFSGKLTLGISAYGFELSGREVQKIGLIIKSSLKKHGVSVRLIPNAEAALSTATSHHNKLGLAENKVEIIIVKGKNSTIIAKSIGAQNITALAARDQGRPRRDAFVGMLPPKLAMMMINMAKIDNSNLDNASSNGGVAGAKARDRILDPFCGTGVLLQEALLLGYNVYGTDLSDKMIRYTKDNLQWLINSHHINLDNTKSVESMDATLLAEGDAMNYKWSQPIDAVISEAYLGQPFSAPPSPEKLIAVQKNCNYIIESFLKNIASQLSSATPVVLAVPAWRRHNGDFVHLPLTHNVDKYGFKRVNLKTVDASRLLYARPDQVVGREILVLKKI